MRSYWITAAFLLVMTLSIFASWTSWHTSQQVKQTQHQDCLSTVSARNDLRALLTDVLAITKNQATIAFFNNELNNLLPPLHCEDGAIKHGP